MVEGSLQEPVRGFPFFLLVCFDLYKVSYGLVWCAEAKYMESKRGG